MAKSIVGLDFGAESLRAVELVNAASARPTLVRHHQVALPAGAVSRGEIVEPHTVGTALEQLWSEGRFGTKDVVLGIGNHRVLARDLTVPKGTLKHIRESLPFQVQDLLPFPAEDAVLDFYPVSETSTEAGPMLNGLLIAALKEVVVGNVAAVQRAGLNPVNVDLVPFALSRIVAGCGHGDKMIAAIDVGAETTTVVVMADGAPQFVRIIPTGGDDLTSALATRLRISRTEADVVKRSGVLGEAGAAVDVLFAVTEELIGSLRNTLNYFASVRPGDPVGSIILSGQGALFPGFVDALAELTRTTVAFANPLAAIAVSTRVDRAALEAQQSALSVAIGLAWGSAA